MISTTSTELLRSYAAANKSVDAAATMPPRACLQDEEVRELMGEANGAEGVSKVQLILVTSHW